MTFAGVVIGATRVEVLDSLREDVLTSKIRDPTLDPL